MKFLAWYTAVLMSFLVVYMLANPVESADESTTWGLLLYAPAVYYIWAKVVKKEY